MSTRAQIRIKDEYGSFELYHHHDGYPEGVGRDLKNYCDELPTGQWSHWSTRRIANDLVKGKLKDPYCGIAGEDMGYEITNGFHADIEYAYLIDCEKKELKCFYVDFQTDYRSLDEIFEKAKTVEIPQDNV